MNKWPWIYENHMWPALGVQALLHSRGGRAGQQNFSFIARYWYSIRTEVANLTKILNGPQGNLASKTAASIEMLNGLENLQQGSELYWYDSLNLLGCMALAVGNIHSVTHHKDHLFTVVDYVRNFGNAAKKRFKGGNPLGGVLFYKSKCLVSCTRMCHDPVSHTSNSTVTTCTDGTTEHTEDEGLGVNICCSALALCQTGNNDGKSLNSSVVPPSERNSAKRTDQSRTLWLRGAARKQWETRRRGRWNIRVRFPQVMMGTFHL